MKESFYYFWFMKSYKFIQFKMFFIQLNNFIKLKIILYRYLMPDIVSQLIMFFIFIFIIKKDIIIIIEMDQTTLSKFDPSGVAQN